MAFLEYEAYDGLGLAKLVEDREVSAEELIEAAIERAEKHNPTLNALVYKMYDLARDAARKSDADPLPGPFRGVPFLLKDLLGNHAGVPTTCASRFMEGASTDSIQDSELVARFKRAGLIPFGKTASSEFGCTPIAESDLFGDCRNPWSLDHSTGGSSGGSAAAVAAGIVPLAHATDGGGSIRIPASCCGLVGMKPTRARNSLGPIIGDVMNGMVVEHAVTRTVRDSAALLDFTAGPLVGDPYMAPPQERPYLEEVSRDPGTLRIATWSKSIRNTEIDPECREATDKTAALLAELGHEVEEVFPPINAELITQSILTVWAAGAAAAIDLFQLAAGRAPAPEFFEPLTWALYERGQSISASQYQRAVTMLQISGRQIAEFFQTYDVWLTPTLEKPPLEIGAIDRHESDIDIAFAPILEYATFTPIFNATGQPAISLPLHWTASGLPVGLHFAGRFGDEATLFRLAAQLEQARPWKTRKPPTLE